MSLMWLLAVICSTNIVVCWSLNDENKFVDLQGIYFNASNLGKPTFPVWQYEYKSYFYFGAILKKMLCQKTKI
ncbi:unnamed protein product [Callosobruchus maculatus]|uniref:Uncharacterized protein n=1 Tax=Callosobruchus maculatus TaxID=64391 RepID=A0A653DF01_CALMS|nr:unnamed protein product [Callosobruchus maculatus]